MNRIEIMEMLLGFVDNVLKDVECFFEMDKEGEYEFEYIKQTLEFLELQGVKHTIGNQELYLELVQKMLAIGTGDYNLMMYKDDKNLCFKFKIFRI